MAAQKLEIVSAGRADWMIPIRVEEDLLKVAYEAWFMSRLTLGDGDVHYLRLRFFGVDEMDNEGEVPSGFGILEFQDDGGDILRGRTDWYRRDGVDRGTWTLDSGTGKWQDAEGTAEMVLHYMPDDLAVELPPTRPVLCYAIVEGTGELSTPNLAP